MTPEENCASWRQAIRSFDKRRDIVVPGDTEKTLLFCVDQFVSLAQECMDARGVFTVALSGGSTPKSIYQMLCSENYRHSISWDKLLLFWSDERCVPPDHSESNYHMAMEAGFARMPIPPTNIFRMQAEADVEKASASYEKQVLAATSGEFDLVMLGMGEDGHTASLFPKTHGLHSEGKLVIANYIPQKKTWRMSLSFKCINNAREISIYVLGKSKADMLKHALTSPYRPDELPIQRVGTPSHKALWIADKPAAEKLLRFQGS